MKNTKQSPFDREIPIEISSLMKRNGQFYMKYRNLFDAYCREDCFIDPFVKEWKPRQRWMIYNDNTDTLINIIEFLGFTYEKVNVAPRGGLRGNRIKINNLALDTIVEIIGKTTLEREEQ